MKVLQAPIAYLASPLGVSDTSLTLQSFLDSKGNTISLSEFGAGTQFALVIRQGTQTEIILCNGITQNSDGTATIAVASTGRNLDPFSPYTGYSTGFAFDAGADVVLGNDPWTMATFANLYEKSTFAVVPASTADPVSSNDLVRLSYIQSLVLGSLTTLSLIVPGTAGATIAAGNLVYLDTATAHWKLATALTANTVQNVILGIAQGAGTNGNPIANGVLLEGLDANQTGLSAGAVYYAGNTAGSIGSSAGTTNVGVGIANDATHLYFKPRFNQQLTQSQIDALVGTSGTSPSSSNKFVDNNDTATSGANKVLRLDSSGKLPPLDGSQLTNLPAFMQKIAAFTNSVSIGSSTVETTLFTTTVAGNLLNTANAIRGLLNFYSFQLTTTKTCTIRIKYGGTTLITLVLTGNQTGQTDHMNGYLDFVLFATGATNSQAAYLTFFALDAGNNTTPLGNISVGSSATVQTWATQATGTSAVDSTASQTLAITAQMNNSSSTDILTAANGVIFIIQ
jgi:hypothetical protein